MADRTVLLLGGTGFVGTNLAARLRADGHRVLVTGRGSATRAGDPAAAIPLAETQALLDLVAAERIDTVVHLASSLIPSSSPIAYPGEVAAVAIPTVRLARGLADAGVRLVFLSSGGTIYGAQAAPLLAEDAPCAPISLYGQVKLEIELHLRFLQRTCGLRCLIVRPSNPFGPFQSLYGAQGLISVIFGKLAKGEALEIWGDGSTVRDYIFVEDAAAVLADLIAQNLSDTTLNLGSGVGHSLLEVVETVGAVMGRRPALVHRPARAVDVPRLVLDVSQLRALGLYRTRPLADGIRAYARWLGMLPGDAG
jgi:UDP-glucose 4-epimerase